MECKLLPNDVLSELNSWKITKDGRDAIIKDFKFKDFKHAYAFLTSIALKAEELGHHPEWSNIYNKVTIILTTHDVDGLSKKDVLLGQSKIDRMQLCQSSIVQVVRRLTTILSLERLHD